MLIHLIKRPQKYYLRFRAIPRWKHDLKFGILFESYFITTFLIRFCYLATHNSLSPPRVSSLYHRESNEHYLQSYCQHRIWIPAYFFVNWCHINKAYTLKTYLKEFDLHLKHIFLINWLLPFQFFIFCFSTFPSSSFEMQTMCFSTLSRSFTHIHIEFWLMKEC